MGMVVAVEMEAPEFSKPFPFRDPNNLGRCQVQGT